MPKSWATSGFVNWFIRFDENKLRPFLIRNYNAGKAELEDQYHEMVQDNYKVDNIDDLAEKVYHLQERRRMTLMDGDFQKERFLSVANLNNLIKNPKAIPGNEISVPRFRVSGTLAAPTAKELF